MTGKMEARLPDYTVAIRTLGTAGEKYQILLNSLAEQTHQPKAIIVYIAEGYDIPKETCGREQYIYVKKGMVAQRALEYESINTEWILFLDDDVKIPRNGIEEAFRLLNYYNADVISPDTYEHTQYSMVEKLRYALLLSAIPRFWSKTKGYTVTPFGSYCYNPYKSTQVGFSTTNAGPAFICRKSDFLNIHFERDLWLDESPYAIPEDQVMFYKMHLNGLKILTQYHSGWQHLDGQTAVSNERAVKVTYSTVRNHRIFYELYAKPNIKLWQKPFVILLKIYSSLMSQLQTLIKCLLRQNISLLQAELQGIRDGKQYLKTHKIQTLSQI